MTEFTPPERHAAPGYTNKDQTQAELFSSDNAATVLRHFQWMEAYGVDGVAVQSFGVELNVMRRKRRVNRTIAAAEQTGRVMYTHSGMTPALPLFKMEPNNLDLGFVFHPAPSDTVRHRQAPSGAG